ncbi:hypothetical protein GlitD10_1744 [Gloeomargarita lithophora Alchichica-D10]|uniref:Ycf35 n=1 Tax=Gloeomargarita lithophora Alchichica-D10 TaxID=1188229 RepID=A0A1J0ADQ1_9CYAN|nr:DUF1257 domain-containing protein [Gloeomargarita lithophora]APB34070.1 hypothetical protein GlitD10_1744 [Gloeomargarita lithophora Alchichica-D10]
MSHFSTIQTSLRHRLALETALTRLNYTYHVGTTAVRGYRGQTQSAELVIPQENGYDIGFVWDGQQYNLVADLQYWQQPLSVAGFMKQLHQQYAYEVVATNTQKQGFQVSESQKLADGSLRLVVQRWAS